MIVPLTPLPSATVAGDRYKRQISHGITARMRAAVPLKESRIVGLPPLVAMLKTSP